MEYMETRELHPTKKAKRVRSWYLYEQYKSLENSQIDGAQLLKDRPCQEKILHQELEERRARRQLCDQLASCQSECRHWPSSMTSDTGTLTSVSTDDFIDNFCEFQESNATIVNSDKTYSLYYDQHKYDDENENKATISYGEESPANSLAEKEIDSNSYLKSELEVVKQNIEDSFNLQLETMKENIQCLEKYATQSYEDKATGELNVKSLKQCKSHKSTEYDNSLFVVWSRLVSFAYQVIRLNRGNCYYDYSTQFMAAVLVCDILCKGVSKMCDILQPYVSPIKFTTDDPDACNDSHVKKNYTISSYSKGSRRSSKNKSRPSKSQIPRPQDGKNNRCKLKRGSQVYDHLRVATFSPRIRLHNSVTTHRLHEGLSRRKHSCSENCSCLNKIVNPMIKLSRYIDSVLKDLED